MAPQGDGDGFSMDPAELTAHENQVRELMSNISGAAGSALTPHDINAFGIIGQAWSWTMNDWTNETKTAIGKATSAGNHVADQLKAMREAHTNNDKDTADSFKKIQGGK